MKRIYRRDNGQLVEITERDSQSRANSITGELTPKRYHSEANVKTGEQYDIEFTDDEEKSRDQEEFQWEQDRPKREAEKRENEKALNDYKEILRYEDRLVVFLDVLGWKELIDKSVNDIELVKKLGLPFYNTEQLRKFCNNVANMGSPCITNISQFSDSIIISFRMDNKFDFLKFNLLSILDTIILQYLEFGMVIRGGITYGKIIHNDVSVYGPALVKAYQLENDAIYPRIILDQDLASEAGLSDIVTGASVDTDGIIEYIKTFRCDRKDDKIYYDFLAPLIRMPAFQRNCPMLKMKMLKLHEVVKKNLEIHSDEKTLSKYKWLAAYFNIINADYPGLNLEVDKFSEEN